MLNSYQEDGFRFALPILRQLRQLPGIDSSSGVKVDNARVVKTDTEASSSVLTICQAQRL